MITWIIPGVKIIFVMFIIALILWRIMLRKTT